MGSRGKRWWVTRGKKTQYTKNVSAKVLKILCWLSSGWSCGTIIRSPGLVVMGGDYYPEGIWFEFPHRILDGHFYTHLL